MFRDVRKAIVVSLVLGLLTCGAAWGQEPPAAPSLGTTLYQSLIKDRDALAQMPLADLLKARQALEDLGDKANGEQLCSDWVMALAGPQTLTPADLQTLCGCLAIGPSGQAARARMAEWAGTCLASPVAVRAAGTGAWNKLVGQLGTALTAESRAVWATQLRAAYVNDAAVFGNMSIVEAQDLTRTLTALGDAQAGGVLTSWVDVVVLRGGLRPTDMAWIATQLQIAGDTGQTARIHFEGYITNQLLADPRAAQALGVATWNSLAGMAAKDLAVEGKAAWVTKLRAALVDDAAALGAMSLADAKTMGKALTVLGDAQGTAVLAKWVENTTTWQALSPADLGLLSTDLSALGTAGQAARVKMADYVGRTYMSNAAAIRSVGTAALSSLATGVGKDLAAETKTAWVAAIRDAYASNAAALAALKVTEAQDVCRTLGALGDAQAATTLTQWTTASLGRQGVTGTELAAMGTALTSSSADVAQASKQALISFVKTEYLADPAKLRSLGAGPASTLATSLAKDLPADAKPAWLGVYRAAFVDDVAASGAMTLTQAKDLAKALTALGEKQGGVAVARWIENSTAWQALKPGDLSALTSEVGNLGDVGQAARAKLADYIGSHYLMDATTVKAVGASTWNWMVGMVGKDMTADAKTEWLAKIRAAYVSDPSAVQSLSAADVQSVSKVLTQLGDPQGGVVLAKWVEQTTQWKDLPPAGMQSLWTTLRTSGEGGAAARAAVLSQIGTKYLSSTSTLRAGGLTPMGELLTAVATDASADARQNLIVKLRAVLADDAGGPAGLKMDEVRLVGDSLKKLGDHQSAEAVSQWMARSGQWQSEKAGNLAWLASALAGAPQASPARGQLMALLEKGYMTDPAAIRSIPMTTWKQLVGLPDMPVKSRVAWAKAFRAAYAATPADVRNLTAGELLTLCDCLAAFGDSDGPTLAAEYLATSEKWQASTKAGDLGVLIAILRIVPSAGEKAKTARQRAVDCVAAAFLDNAEDARKVQLDLWAAFVELVAQDMTAQARQEWARLLRTYFADGDQALLAMKPAAFRGLFCSLSALDKPSAEAAFTWLDTPSSWTEALPQDLAELVAAAARVDKAKAVKLMDAVEKLLIQRMSKERFGWEVHMQIIDAWKKAGGMSRAQDWATRAFTSETGNEEARARLDMDTLRIMGKLLKETGLTGKGKGYATMAASIVQLASAGKLDADGEWYFYVDLAAPLGTPESRQVVREALLDAQGSPRLGVVKILTYAYQSADESAAWCKSLDEKLAAASGGGDERALWLLARAFAESTQVASSSATPPSPLRAQAQLEEALKVANSQEIKLQVVRMLARGYAFVGKYETALTFLDDVATQFNKKEALASIESSRGEVYKAWTLASLAGEKSKTRPASLFKEELARRLDAAKAANDQESVDRYERLLHAE
jgi:hypothetical protein